MRYQFRPENSENLQEVLSLHPKTQNYSCSYDH